jgi:hypothetical protein
MTAQTNPRRLRAVPTGREGARPRHISRRAQMREKRAQIDDLLDSGGTLTDVLDLAKELGFVGIVEQVPFTYENARHLWDNCRYSKNRKQSNGNVTKLFIAMTEGNFGENDSAICFAEVDGAWVMMNGHGRTEARINAGSDAPGVFVDVKLGVPVEAYRNMDIGLKRSLKDLFLEQEWTSDMAAVVRRYMSTAGYNYDKVPESASLNFMDDPANELVLAVGAGAYAAVKTSNLPLPSAVAAVAMVVHEELGEGGLAMYHKLVNNDGLRVGTRAWHYRRVLEGLKIKKPGAEVVMRAVMVAVEGMLDFGPDQPVAKVQLLDQARQRKTVRAA